MTRQAVIVGGGLGGLSCAIRLALGGMKVTLVEQGETLGGKLQQVTASGYRFDRGPSTITMPEAFREVYTKAGRHMEDYVSLYRVEPVTRNFFADGSIVDLCSNTEAIADQIARYSAQDALQFPRFMRESARLYELSERYFLRRSMSRWSDKLDPRLLGAFVRIRPWQTLERLLLSYFRHPNTLQLLGRYATYVGSSPYQAPSIFAMMAQLESGGGVYGVQGGTYELVRGFTRLAEELGVMIYTDTKAKRIRVLHKQVVGVDTSRGFMNADQVVFGADALSAYLQLVDAKDRPSMPIRRITSYEPSLSGYAALLGVRTQYDQLQHHNVFFSADYEREFEQLFSKGSLIDDPTLYVCWSGKSDQGQAPAGRSNLFLLANAPAIHEGWDGKDPSWEYAKRMLDKLEACGLSMLQPQTELMMTYTPYDLQRDTNAYKGAIYGISSHTFSQSFLKPPNRSPDVSGLWFTGGTTHPGGGTPIVTLSGQLVAEQILRIME